MVLTKKSRLRVEPLEDRCLPSANVILEWNQLALHAVGQARLSPVFVSRDLAITQAAVYDAVVAIDKSFDPFHAHVQASSGASQEAAAAGGGNRKRQNEASTMRPKARHRPPRGVSSGGVTNHVKT